MKLHHFGYACRDIPSAIEYIKSIYKVTSVSEILYDPYQDASVCLIQTDQPFSIELVSGNRVKNLYNDGVNFYHVCYEVKDIYITLDEYLQRGAVQVGEVVPAKLFDNRMIAFLHTDLGLIELLSTTQVQNDAPGLLEDLSSRRDSIKLLAAATFNMASLTCVLQEALNKLAIPWELKQIPADQLFFRLSDPQGDFFIRQVLPSVLFIRVSDWIDESLKERDALIVFQNWIEKFVSLLQEKSEAQQVVFHIYLCPSNPMLKKEKISHFEEVFLAGLSKLLCAHVYNYKTIFSKKQLETYFDFYADSEAQIPYLECFEKELGICVLKNLIIETNEMCKLVAVDCDDTLWSGVCAEDGVTGLSLSADNLLLQNLLVDCYRAGKVVCVCSKNHLEDVIRVFDEISGMPLKKEYVTIFKVNWESKAKNLKEISQLLNIRLNNFLFIDNNYYECLSVLNELPEVSVLQFLEKSSSSSVFFDFFQRITARQSIDFSAEQRQAWYQSHLSREKVIKDLRSPAGLMDALRLVFDIQFADRADFARISELSYRTTQFNATGKQYAENDLNNILSKTHDCLTLRMKDRFGDYGLVGVLIFQRDGCVLVVENFLLSCRALGRGAEFHFLKYLACQTNNADQITSVKIFLNKTPKNIPVRQFLEHIADESGATLMDDRFYLFDINVLKDLNFVLLERSTPLNEVVVDERAVVTSAALFSLMRELLELRRVTFSSGRGVSPQQSNLQTKILSSFAQFLKGKNVDLNTHFFESGGDSLAALRLSSRLVRDFGLDIKLKDIFQYPTAALLAEYLTEISSGKSFARIQQGGDSPQFSSLAPNQKSLWFIDQYFSASWFYNIPISYRLSGELDYKVLEQSFLLLISRHSVLRTRFLSSKNRVDRYVEDKVGYKIDVADLSNLTEASISQIIRSEELKPFDLRVAPLIRVRLYKLAEGQHVLLMVFPHIIFDGGSHKVLCSELNALYAAIKSNRVFPPKTSALYSNFVERQSRYLSSSEFDKDAEYWKSALKDIGAVNLPWRVKQATENDFIGDYYHFDLDNDLFSSLKSLAKRHNSTLYSTLLTAFFVLLHRASGQEDLVIGTPVDLREVDTEQDLIGDFINTLVMRVRLSHEDCLKTVIEKVDNVVKESLDHRNMPFERLVSILTDSRDTEKNPLFQVLFAFQDERYPHLSFSGVTAEYYHRGYHAARLPLILEINVFDDRLDGGFYYPKHLSMEMIRGFFHAYIQILHYMCQQEIVPIGEIPLLNEESSEEALKNGFAFESAFINHFRFFSLFDTWVRKQPEAEAVCFAGKVWSYKTLDVKSNQLSEYLSKDLGLLKGDRLSVLLPVGINLITTIIACFRLGVVYAPFGEACSVDFAIDASENLGAKVLLTSGVSSTDYIGDIRIVDLLDKQEIIAKKLGNPIDAPYDLSGVAYIVHTSGSTGKPKGVEVTYHNLSCLIEAMNKKISISPQDRMPLFHSCSFDVSIWEIVGTLAAGATLFLVPREEARSPEAFSSFIESKEITILHQTPSAFENLLRYLLDHHRSFNAPLKYVFFTGEALNRRLCQAWSRAFPMHNTKFYDSYGISETTIYTTFHEIDLFHEDDYKPIIGKPLLGESLMLLDSAGFPVPIGFIGEIYVSGEGVAKSYVNDSNLSKKKFLSIAGYRVYKTGDLARELQNKQLEYINRIDHQIKLDGYRIDLEAISSILNDHFSIHSSCVLLCESASANKYLEAFILPNLKIIPELPYLLESLENNYPTKFTQLSNGMTVAYHNKLELSVLDEEIFQQEDYLTHGITLYPGDCIFDVGANIGLFSLQVSGLASDLKLFSFEPVPEVFELLKLNCQMRAPGAICFNVALGEEQGETSFTYYPNASVLSSIEADQVEDKALIQKFLNKRLQENVSQVEMNELIDSRLEPRYITCQIQTISSMIEKFDLQVIDLLKIDVEKSELAVLKGIKYSHWKRIRQIVVEVHDRGNRFEEVKELLQSHGFLVNFKQSILLEGTGLYTLYAISSHFPMREPLAQTECKYYNIARLTQELREYSRKSMPAYMLPAKFSFLDKLPLNQNGKIDRKKLKNLKVLSYNLDSAIEVSPQLMPQSDAEYMLMDLWKRLLGHDSFSTESNFFEVGGSSLLILQLYNELLARGYQRVKLMELFVYPSIIQLANHLQQTLDEESSVKKVQEKEERAASELANLSGKIAVIGMTVKLPGANSLEAYWENLSEGRDCATWFTDEELSKMGVPDIFINNENYLKLCGYIPDIDQFDADLFSYTAAQAVMIDPQQRLFLEVVWQALEASGYCPEKYPGKIGVYAGMEDSGYTDLLSEYNDLPKYSQSKMLYRLANDKDFLSTRVAYKLNCTGSTLNINTGSSTGLVCIAKASQALINHEADIMVAGSAALILPHQAGYLYEDGGIYSQQGECRPFDENNDGTFPASGIGAVILKRLEDAERDGDTIYAVVSGYSVNNDGASKVGFAAPSALGQENCIREAWEKAGITANDIDCIEAHGTATHLGDMIEVSALNNIAKYFSVSNEKEIAIGSVKANFGHAQSAAGLASFIKMVLMIHHKKILPTIHHDKANSDLELNKGPFYVNTCLKDWDKVGAPRVGAVSSFGMGGVNAHIVIESSVCITKGTRISDSKDFQSADYVPISAANEMALLEQLTNLASFVTQLPESELNQDMFKRVAYTLKLGRKDLPCRILLEASSCHSFLQKLRNAAEDLNAYRHELICSLQRLQDNAEIYLSWLNGGRLNWAALIQDKSLPRVVLPTYPFQRKSYWPEKFIDGDEKSFSDELLSVQAFLKRDEITSALRSLCAKILGADKIDMAKSFEDLGGDSLFVLTFIAEIKKAFGVDVPLEICLESPIAKLSEKINLLVNDKRLKKPSIVTLREGDNTLPPIIFIHPGYGELYQYRYLTGQLKTKRPIYGIQNSPFNDPPFEENSIEKIALSYLDMLGELPIKEAVLMGWSFGGTLAYEMAYQAELQGSAVRGVVMFDNWAKYDEKFTSYQEVKDYYYELDFMRDGIQPEDVDIWWELNYKRALLLYRHQPKPLNSLVLLLKAEKSKEAAYTNILDNYWEACAGKYFKCKLIHCNHETILDKEYIGEYLEEIDTICRIKT